MCDCAGNAGNGLKKKKHQDLVAQIGEAVCNVQG